MVIDPSETEVFEGIALQPEGVSLGFSRIEPALANGFEQTTKGRGFAGLNCHGKGFPF
jgi:hypothetical protein